MQLLGHCKDLGRCPMSFATIEEIRAKVQTLDLVDGDEPLLFACDVFLPRSQEKACLFVSLCIYGELKCYHV